MASKTGCRSVVEAADDLQDVRRRGLLLERLLRLVEQAHVLDRDRGLVGEGLAAARPGASAFRPGSRHATTSAPSGSPSRSIGAPSIRRQWPVITEFGVVVRVGRGVRDLDYRACSRMVRPLRSCGLGRRRIDLGEVLERFARPVVRGAEVHQLAVERKVAASSASQSATALFRIASNTGCTSVGEPLMTLRISAVAVCCSSDSLVSLNSRTFSIAITAWSAKVLSRSICFSRERPDFGAANGDAADRPRPSLEHRHREVGSRAAQFAVATRSASRSRYVGELRCRRCGPAAARRSCARAWSLGPGCE